jgi:hypothetical protein
VGLTDGFLPFPPFPVWLPLWEAELLAGGIEDLLAVEDLPPAA